METLTDEKHNTDLKQITPEQQLSNVAATVMERTTPSRTNVGRSDNYAAGKDEIAQASRQLAEMILAYLRGELASIPNDKLPF